MIRKSPKLSEGAKNKRAWWFRRRKWAFGKRMAAAVAVNKRRTKIAKGELQTDDFDWNKQFIPWFKRARRTVLKRDGFVCRSCGRKSKRKLLHVHHIVPRKYGGDERKINLISLCKECHKKHEIKLVHSGLFDMNGKWRKLSRDKLLVAAVKASGLRDAILMGSSKV